MIALARKMHNKSSINIVVANRKAWSAYHCIFRPYYIVINLLCQNPIGSDAATASRLATSHPENYE